MSGADSGNALESSATDNVLAFDGSCDSFEFEGSSDALSLEFGNVGLGSGSMLGFS